MERKEESRVRNANMEVQCNCRYQRNGKQDGRFEEKSNSVSTRPFHSYCQTDKVTHLMTRTPCIKLARPIALREMERVEQKAYHICCDGYHEWGCTFQKRVQAISSKWVTKSNWIGLE